MSLFPRTFCTLCLVLSLSACVSTIIDTAVDSTIAVAKVPIKVAGAAIDVVKGDGNKKSKDDDSNE